MPPPSLENDKEGAGLKDPKRSHRLFLYSSAPGVLRQNQTREKRPAGYVQRRKSAHAAWMCPGMWKNFNDNQTHGFRAGVRRLRQGSRLTEKCAGSLISIVFPTVESASEVFNILAPADTLSKTAKYGRPAQWSVQKNTIVMAASNIGAQEIEKCARRSVRDAIRSAQEAEIREYEGKQMDFPQRGDRRPELINRIDEIIFFHRLTRDPRKRLGTWFRVPRKRLDERSVTSDRFA